jgi:transcription initiation factor TFIIH subunit 2
MKIRCNVISLSAEIYVCKRLAEVTHGSFSVARDTLHLSELIMSHTVPPVDERSTASKYADFVYMGFPNRSFDVTPSFAYDGRNVIVTSSSYVCPRCCARVTEIPAQCAVCSLQLNSSSHIARSYHHLFPVENFVECGGGGSIIDATRVKSCEGCTFVFSSDSMKMQCPKCQGIFCVECDIFIHDSLHNCPGCSAKH